MQSHEQLWLSTGAAEEPEYDADAVIADVYCNPRRRAYGFWAITQHTWDPTIRITSDRVISTDEADQIRGLMADLIDRERWSSLPEYGSLVREGAGPINRLVWSGYVHNAVTGLIGMALIWSLGWIRDRHIQRRSAVRIAHGCCPLCGYDLRGELDLGCPECGWRRDFNLLADSSQMDVTTITNARM